MFRMTVAYVGDAYTLENHRPDAEVCTSKADQRIFPDAVYVSASDDHSCGSDFRKGLRDLESVRLKQRNGHGDSRNDRICSFGYLCPLFYHYLPNCL